MFIATPYNRHLESCLIQALFELHADKTALTVFSSGTLCHYIQQICNALSDYPSFLGVFGDYEMAPTTLEEFGLILFEFTFETSTTEYALNAKLHTDGPRTIAGVSQTIRLDTLLFSHYIAHENQQHLNFSHACAKHYYNRDRPSRELRIRLKEILEQYSVGSDLSAAISLSIPLGYIEHYHINLSYAKLIHVKRVFTFLSGLEADPALEFSLLLNNSELIGVQHAFAFQYGNTYAYQYAQFESEYIFPIHLHWGLGRIDRLAIFPPRYDTFLGRGLDLKSSRADQRRLTEKRVLIVLQDDNKLESKLQLHDLLHFLSRILLSCADIQVVISVHPCSSIRLCRYVNALLYSTPNVKITRGVRDFDLPFYSLIILQSPLSSLIGAATVYNIPFTCFCSNPNSLIKTALTTPAHRFLSDWHSCGGLASDIESLLLHINGIQNAGLDALHDFSSFYHDKIHSLPRLLDILSRQ